MWKPLTLALLGAGLGCAQQPAPKPNDYSDPKSWLCRPGQHDACDVDLTTTVIKADGSLSRETWAADPKAPVDCFYVYPTVSTDPTPNSDMVADEAERNVIRQQFARFASKCRPYAPMYRQITLAGLRLLLAGGGGGASLEHGLQYDDVRDAWKYYLEHDNQGRGFVLVGHSQGSFILAELIRQEIDGKPVQSRMVSAILPGATMFVPRGKEVGGSFQHVPFCHSPSQTGCVIAYSSFRSTIPPPANTLFGKVADKGMVAACANPAALGGGSGELHGYLSKDGRTIAGTTPPKPWVTPERPIDTPWVSVPGLLTAQCTSNENATYLEVTVHPDPVGKRTNDIVGDLGANGQVLANWGLHLVDVNLAMGNLLDVVGLEEKAWLAKPASASSRTVAGRYSGQWAGSSSGSFQLSLDPDTGGAWKCQVTFTLSGEQVKTTMRQCNVDQSKIDAAYDFDTQGFTLRSHINGQWSAKGVDGTYRTTTPDGSAQVDQGTWSAARD